MAFGHQMLHTTPESLHEELPFEDKESGLVITADARIDNRKELAPTLGIEDKEHVSDSYFILKAYEKWGDKCPEELLGDFAFVIWDKNSEKLFGALDHVGVKPLYYFLSKTYFFFSTEIKPFFDLSEIPHKLNQKALLFYLMDVYDNELTFYEDIYSFSPANSFSIDYNHNEIIKYWELNPNAQLVMDSEEDYIKTFRSIFSTSINCRLRSAYPIGFQLSGGLDSSSIVCMAKEIMNKKKNTSFDSINTFSYVFDEFTQCDERYYIKKVTDMDGIEPHFIVGDNISPFEQMRTILWYQEQPFITPFMTILWKLYKKMQRKDIRIVLSGSGGDAVISYGTNYLRDLAASFKWKKLINEINGYSNRVDLGFNKLFLWNVIFPLIPKNLKNMLFLSEKKSKTFILNKDMARQLNAKKLWEDFYLDPISEADTAKKYHYYLLTTENLSPLRMLDKTISAFSIEPRYPFLDKRLIEFCYAIPTEMKFKFGWSRYILRIAMSGILPKEIQWRADKAILSPVLEKNLMLFEKSFLEEKILNNKELKEYIDLDSLNSIYQEYSKGIASYESIRRIWGVSLFFWWFNGNDIIK
ncbi:asparagine synthase (glutamine-hydrolyzing) [Methanobacterium petrolearium]|nr:asparagine synthase (glutamine-hydrolyzing) [Methanobacterium petrolearium]